MYGLKKRQAALETNRKGYTLAETAKAHGVSTSAVIKWKADAKRAEPKPSRVDIKRQLADHIKLLARLRKTVDQLHRDLKT